MSPEQVRGQHTDARSDIFAAGAVLYEMLTGKPAFRKATSAETMSAILTDRVLGQLRNIPSQVTEYARAIQILLGERSEGHAIAGELLQMLQSLQHAFTTESVERPEQYDIKTGACRQRRTWIGTARDLAFCIAAG